MIFNGFGIKLCNIKDNFYNDYHNWILWLPIFFMSGILLFLHIDFYTIYFLYILYFLFSLLSILKLISIFGVNFTHKYSDYLFILKFILIVITTTLFGYVRFALYTNNIKTSVINDVYKNVNINGKIYDISYYKRNNNTLTRLIIEVNSVNDNEGYKLLNYLKYIRINLNENNKLIKYGDMVEVNANIIPMQEQIFYNSYNPKREYYYQQIGAVAINGIIKKFNTPPNISIRDKFYNIRNVVNEHIINKLGDRNGALIGSFVTGIRGKIYSDDYNNILSAGLVHLIAISGMNMAITMGLVFAFFRRVIIEITYLSNKFDVKKICAFIAIISGFLYLSITGFPVSAVRAYIMSAMYFVAIIIDRPPDIMRFLSFASIYILIDEPNLILNVGFQFSFLAVIGLIAIFTLLKQYRMNLSTQKLYLKPYFYLLTLIVSNLTAELFILPLSIYHFNTYNFYSTFANLIAIPLTTFITIPFTTISVFLIPFGLDKYPLIISEWSIEILILVARYFSKISNEIVLYSPSDFSILTILFGLLWFSLWQEKWRFLGVFICFIGLGIAFFQPQPNTIIDLRNKVIISNENKKVYFSDGRSSYKNKNIAKKLGKNNYKIKKDIEIPFMIGDLKESNCNEKLKMNKIKEYKNISVVSYCDISLIN